MFTRWCSVKLFDRNNYRCIHPSIHTWWWCCWKLKGNKKFLHLIYFFSEYLLNKNKSELVLFLSLERSYVSLHGVFFFFCQVKFMKKGISQEMLADLCYCDTSVIYLVTSGRRREKRSLLSWRKYQWKWFVWASESVGKQAGIIQVLHFSPCPVMSIAFDRWLQLRGISLVVLEVHLHRWSQIKTTGLSFVKNSLCFPLCSEVIVVTTDCPKKSAARSAPPRRRVMGKFLLNELAGVPAL